VTLRHQKNNTNFSLKALEINKATDKA